MTARIVFLLACACALVLPQSIHARLGEKRSALERRLLEKKSAIDYGTDRALGKLTDKTVPYKYIAEAYPPECQHVFYFKKIIDEKATTVDIEKPSLAKAHQVEHYPDGWDLHVVFLRDTSVFECYRLNHERLNEFQINSLLDLNRGTSKWRELKDEEEPEPSILSYEYVTEDGKFRAKLYSNMLVIYSVDLDKTIMKAVEGKVAEQIDGF